MTAGTDDRTVLITGASAGIGRAAALEFTRRGAKVLAVARSVERLEDLARTAPGPGTAVPYPADVTDGASMKAMAARILAEHGAPDVVVANAGIGLDARFADTTDEAFRRVLDVNVLGVLGTARPFVPEMVRRGSGRILFISSIVGKRGIPNYAAYSASKFALRGMADALRVELWQTGVTVGIVCPASTESEFRKNLIRSGPAQPSVRVARHSAESVARAIVRMAGSRRREIVLTAEGKFLNALNRLSPALVDRLLARVLRSKKKG